MRTSVRQHAPADYRTIMRVAYWDTTVTPVTLCTMALDRDSLTPLYLQLAGDLRARIDSGQLTGRIPPIVDLAADYDVSEATVRAAVQVLKDDDIVGTSRGRGTFVKRT